MKYPPHIKLNPRTCYKIAREGKIDAYYFAKSLATLTEHPILLNYNANATAYRILLGLTDRKYRQLFNLAIKAGFARYEGDNLCLISISEEKKRYKARTRHYQLVKREDIKSFIYISTINKNQADQISAIRYKLKLAANKPCSNISDLNMNEYALLNRDKINQQVTLSYRSAAKLFSCSISQAYVIVKSLAKKGLIIIHKHIIEISKDFFRTCLSKNIRSIRYDKETAKFYFVKANTLTINKFYAIPIKVVSKHKTKGVAFYNNDNW